MWRLIITASSITPCPSFTTADGISSEKLTEKENHVSEELGQTEREIKMYGADDPQELLPKDHVRPSSSLPVATSPAKGLSKISWDGNDDPGNPQNWPYSKRWRITFICMLLTVNVYVKFN
jgi:hypothetical protein